MSAADRAKTSATTDDVSGAFLKGVRSEISDSAEFRALAGELYGGVRDALRAENLPSFGTLTRSEQESLVNRVRQQLIDTETYARCRDATWRALDAALDAESETLLSKRGGNVGGRRGPGPSWPADLEEEGRDESKAEGTSGKVGTILELASASASSLLDRWPAAQDELLWLLNTELPSALRHSVWDLKLRAPAARAEYERKRSESVFATLSLRDGAISQGCQATLQRIAPAMLKQIGFLKTCLSYADSLRPLPPPPSGWPSAILDTNAAGGGGGAAPPEKAAAGGKAGGKGGGKDAGSSSSGGAIHTAPLESFWGVPLLKVFVGGAQATRSSEEQAELEATLIEHFLALLAMPKPLLGLAADKKGKADKGKNPLLPPTAEALLAKSDEELGQKLASMLGVTGVDAMLLPYAQRLAVGFFSIEVAAFVWDLCLLAGWQALQPALCTALMCMREGLLTCADATAIKNVIAAQGPLLSIEQVRLVP